MYQSFSGSSRRPRQVNLSGRTVNPFAAHPPGGRHPPSGPGPQATLALAQQERAQRQLERDRLNASRTLQRLWRGYNSRKITRKRWRAQWDSIEQTRGGADIQMVDGGIEGTTSKPFAYQTPADCLSQLRILLHFVEFNNKDDAARLAYFGRCFQQTLEDSSTLSAEGDWTPMLSRLGNAALRSLAASISASFPPQLVNDLLQLLMFLSSLVPKLITRQAREYYLVMASLTLRLQTQPENAPLIRDTVVKSVLALLQPITSETLHAYEWFARVYLTVPSLATYLGSLDQLAAGVNYKLLASALDAQVLHPSDLFTQSMDTDARLWLLSYFIYFQKHALGDSAASQAPEVLFVKVVASILSSAAGEVAQRLDAEEEGNSRRLERSRPLPLFVRTQLSSLVNPQAITHLLAGVGPDTSASVNGIVQQTKASDDAKALASYALTLVRVFPRRGDEIRMWLYLGSASTVEGSGDAKGRLPAIKYFWNASRSTKVFRNIVQNPRDALAMLLPPGSSRTTNTSQENASRVDREQEWTVILLFLELYTFLLKVLDDEEFFSASPSSQIRATSSGSWTQESALPLGDVKSLTVFLKNLAFTLYWNAADLAPSGSSKEPAGLHSYFSTSVPLPQTLPQDVVLKAKSSNLGGVTGIPLNYFKGLVTGLLRMIHERDSRRKFLPDGHWLMTGRLDMEGFIPMVVAEEENRHQLQDDEDEDEEDLHEEESMEEETRPSLGLVGTGRAQQVQRIELLRRRQQQLARKKELEAVAPRLEILRNIPFFIPFATRVQIFREFIYRDQMRRRQGFVDPDSWRLSIAQSSMALNEDGRPIAHDILSKHHADIRRDNLFEDAYRQFYPLGDGLKEPIQITFIDKFDTVEAGIDGGGVTKEFLTSVINDAFKPSGDFSLFVENDQHLLYPNPTAVEQRKALLRQAGIPDGSAEWNVQIRESLKRYEFLGRIIGKCLYEGILVDVNFAGFFLLKWALTGGSSSARKESAYRANLNDLRDLDESLYQGLLQLKNYPGDVEEFSLNFTVTDTINVPGSANNGSEITQTITRDLKPDGSNIAVTNQNRLVYISYMARHRLQIQPYLQTNAFLQGLGQIIQPSWLSMFNQAELQTLVGGDAGDIDVADLRRNTIYSGVYVIGEDNQEHPTVKLFWDVLESMSNAERQKFLKFVTSTPRAPLLGFSHLNPRFSIRDSSDDEERLPSASTCANLLKLPRYTRVDTLREKLMYAINSGAGFDLS
ncbi:hypothetical protein AJ80_03795 [Polytolypa hystricis UAMH7299]|uniref:HECT-type E3 ubiquitin transferase n=1 Tax=Polytolypa hystricis (strain UAMH7299) TaxID=1447883 RepID=A0A2B7YEB6_POLH7|nr:hypothetical protein AJ80_03795 [Polytolypa hystricis UAMH7299]